MRALVGGLDVAMWVREGVDLKELIKKSGRSGAQTGRKVGVTGQMISQLVSRKCSCSTRVAARIVKALDDPALTIDKVFEMRVRESARSGATSSRAGSRARDAA